MWNPRRQRARGRASVTLAVAGLVSCSAPAPEPWPLETDSSEARQAFRDGIEAFDRLRMSEAREAFSRAVGADPDFALARAYRALAMNSSGDVKGELAAARRAAEPAGELTLDLVASHVAWASGDARGALEAMQRVIAALPENRQAHLEQGLLQLRVRRPAEAVASLERAAALDPAHGATRAHLARALLAAGEDDRARQAAAAAIERLPTEPLSHLVAGEVARRRADYAAARAAFGRALELDPDHVPALQGRAYTLRLLGEHAAARKDFRRAFEISAALPDGAWKEEIQDWNKAEDTSFDLAVSHLLEGDVEAAITAARDTVAYTETARPANAVFYHHALGRILLESGRLDEALDAYRAGEESIRRAVLGEQDRQLWHGRYVHAQGRILAKRGRFDQAQAVAEGLRQMIEQAGPAGDPYRPSLHYLQGYIRLEQGRFAEAVAELEQADQGDPFIQWLLARAHRGAGEHARAREIIDQLRRRRDTGFRWALVSRDVATWEDAAS